MAYQNSDAYGDLYRRIIGNTGPGGFVWNQQNTTGKLGDMATQFAGMFRNLTGRDPTDQEYNAMFQNIGNQVATSPSGFSGTSYADFQNLFAPYIQNTYGSDIQQFQQGQQQSQLDKAQKTIQDLIGKQTAATAANLTDPNSKTFQAFAGNLNNLGITPGSGAFQAGLGATLGESAANDISAALGGVSLPAITGIMDTANMPYKMSLENMYPGLATYGNRQNDIYDFNLQTALAQKLFDESQPSGFEKNLGYANTASGIVGNAGMAAGPAMTATSYICKALIAHGLAAESDLDLLHLKTLGAVWKKARAFWWYATHAKQLVEIAERDGLDWREWRKCFLDDPISKETAVEAVEEYITAYESLCRHLDAMHLWDERVRRSSFWDSLLFLPLVFTYPPFLKAAWKVFKIKQLILLDLPLTRMP